MDEHELTAKHNLAETCCASISIDELVSLSEKKDANVSDILNTSAIQNYGEIPGSSALRENLSRLYSTKTGSPLSADNILIQPGAIAANNVVFYALLEAGDHVICHYPTYQQLYSVPASLGAKVDLWKSKADNKWLPDYDELEAMVTDQTKMIILNNPQNPTGAVLPRSLLVKIVELAEKKGIIVLSDEVYRPLFHGITPLDKDFPPSILSLGYANTIATGSMSKAYSLAGIRIGWVASRSKDLVEKIQAARHYTTISVSQLDQAVAAFALSPDTIHSLLGRNIQLAKTNLELLDRFIVKHDEYCSYVKPVAGTTAFVKFERDGKATDATVLCQTLQEKTGVMFLPGDVGFGEEFKGYVRIGYVNRTEIIKEGLEEARKFMRKEYDDLPLNGD
jgi:aspartate/methionine/tyrosine aminotransferase